MFELSPDGRGWPVKYNICWEEVLNTINRSSGRDTHYYILNIYDDSLIKLIGKVKGCIVPAYAEFGCA